MMELKEPFAEKPKTVSRFIDVDPISRRLFHGSAGNLPHTLRETRISDDKWEVTVEIEGQPFGTGTGSTILDAREAAYENSDRFIPTADKIKWLKELAEERGTPITDPYILAVIQAKHYVKEKGSDRRHALVNELQATPKGGASVQIRPLRDGNFIVELSRGSRIIASGIASTPTEAEIFAYQEAIQASQSPKPTPSPTSKPNHVPSLIREMSRERGKFNEENVLRILQFGPRPPWITSVRKGTTEEDLQGTDIVVTTKDIGNISLQVKSSGMQAKQFKETHPDTFAVVVARLGEHDEVISQRLFEELESVHQFILRRRKIQET
jgi:hypothetical protein